RGGAAGLDLSELVDRPRGEEQNAAGAVGDAAVVVRRVGEPLRGAGEPGDVAARVADEPDLVERAAGAVRLAADQQPVGRPGLERETAEARRHAGRRTEVLERVGARERCLELEGLGVRRRTREREREDGQYENPA